MHNDLKTLVDAYIEKQGSLATPVARFAQAHDTGNDALIATAREGLVPLSVPGPGEQYAFEVNLDACTGCKACVSACHSLNGLDEGEAWRDVGLVLGVDPLQAYQQTITSACHHCADPGCLNGCPVLAYEKDPVTGIVRHLDDQCIGCQYCILKCPYDVPKFNPRLGIVRKCDMCHQRLAVGEAPACAQACPTHAIRIVKVPVGLDEGDRPSCPTEQFLAAAPEADRTRPTTRYVSKTPIPKSRAADAWAPLPQPGHLPLVLMLTLTQAGYGLLAASLLEDHFHPASPGALTGLALIAAGLTASAAHLGQPLRMWRVFLNLRRSWLSREAVLLGLSFKLLLLSLGVELLALPELLGNLCFGMGMALGALGVFCSAMIYIDTGRHFWRPLPVLLRMGGTCAVFLLLPLSAPLAALALLTKLLVESTVLLSLRNENPRLRAPAFLHAGPLRKHFATRIATAMISAVLLVLGVDLLLCGSLMLLGELLERSLFFKAVDPSAMPGQVAAASPSHH